MTREYIASANTVDEAIDIACRELGITPDEISSREVLQLPKKGLFGKIKQQAKVKVVVDDGMDAIPVPPAPLCPRLCPSCGPGRPRRPEGRGEKGQKTGPGPAGPGCRPAGTPEGGRTGEGSPGARRPCRSPSRLNRRQKRRYPPFPPNPPPRSWRISSPRSRLPAPTSRRSLRRWAPAR